MSVTLSGEDHTVHTRMQAVSPSTGVAAGVWLLGDDLPNGDDIAVTRLAVGPGFVGALDVTLVRPDDTLGDSTVRLTRRYLDAADAVLSSFSSTDLTVDAAGATHTMTLSAAPAGTVACELALVSAMDPPGDPVRVNEYVDPRCSSAAGWFSRTGWDTPTAETSGSNIGGVTGLGTFVQAKPSDSGSAAQRGITRGGWTFLSDPTTGSTASAGLPVAPGDTFTISGWMRCSKAVTGRLGLRAHNGATWSAAETGANVTLAANTWNRVSATVTIPAGATTLAISWYVNADTAWTAADHIAISGLLMERAGSLADYFDGTTTNGISGHTVRWDGPANNAHSLLYAAPVPGATTVQATDSALSYNATCEDILGAALERDLRRSVAEVWSEAQSLITAGTAALLSGQLTFLCASLAHALALDAVYRMPGLVTLTSGDELDGLTHRAVGRARINPERVLPGRTPRWLLVIDFREQAS